MRGEAYRQLEIDDGDPLLLTTISCNVYLKTLQAEDADLAAARQMLARAAVVIGRLEDAIVFNGQLGRDMGPRSGAPSPDIFTVRGGGKYDGLRAGTQPPVLINRVPAPPPPPPDSDDLVAKIVRAIQALEGSGHYGPFACVLGDELYEAANRPAPGSLVLPSDRIVPFLGGPLLRSGTVPRSEGVVVALAGSPIDLVVATDVHVSYVQLSVEPRYVLRVSERFVLRMKQPDAACRLYV
jgi:hypothetical protein